ncbi:putative lantibiotic ABC transporter, ATP-binding protein [[Clostridium] sordellii ATCC 9714]|nr:putative lantibiotic ABC transporter, ATP-binding protein [[Clostridium] sordellii ATCC 9714] [Paeniclostridium sordellii ATCC 9714]
MLLEVKNIEKYYGNRRILTKALDDLSFEVDEGEFISIMGASGSGKTTLLNCISTIDTVSAGKILLENNDITELPESHLLFFVEITWALFFKTQIYLIHLQ